MRNYNTSNRGVQAPNSVRCAVLRVELVTITQDHNLAILLNQLIYEARHDLRSWIRVTGEDMIAATLLTVTPKSMRTYLRRLEAMGFLQLRDTIDPYDRAHEYRLNMDAIEKAVTAAGFTMDFLPDPSTGKAVPCNKEKKTLNPLRSLKSKELNDIHIQRAREVSDDPEITELRKAYQEIMQGIAEVNRDTPTDFSTFLEYEIDRVSHAIFKRPAKSAGESELVQLVVDGDIPLSYAAALPQKVDLFHLGHRSVLYHAIQQFKDVSVWKKMTHPIRYLAKCIENAITADCLDRFRINPLYA